MLRTNLHFKKTRIAPTPSGYLHLGNILSFAITAALAQKTGAKILLRIDDFDLERTNSLYINDIFNTLNFLQIPWDEGPRNFSEYEQTYSQRHRMHQYKAALEELKEKQLVFACTCSRAQVLKYGSDHGYPGTCENKHIPLDTPNTSWRLFTNYFNELQVKTLQGTTTTSLPSSMHDFIVKRKDDVPSYQLISVLDDLTFGIDLVVRGEDLWPSTVAQLYLAAALGRYDFADITFYHHPLIIGADGKKLSKSEGATSVHFLRKEGKNPTDIYTMLGQAIGIEGNIKNWQELTDKMQTAF